MAMNIENITKAEVEILVEALCDYTPQPSPAQMSSLILKAIENGAKTPREAQDMVNNGPEVKKIGRDVDRKKMAAIGLKLKLEEILDRAAEFEVPEPEKPEQPQ